MAAVGRYDSLGRWLTSQGSNEVTLSFTQIGGLVGGLPPSSSGRTWWANSGKGQSAGWLNAGWVVASVDVDRGQVRFRRGERTPRGAVGRAAILDGAVCLEATVTRAGWPSVVSAVAAHTVFLDPATVAQTDGRAVFPVVRDPARRGQFGVLPDGRSVLFDDNTTPTDVFLWAAQRVKGRDVQFNHVWSAPSDPNAYTSLWNLCCTPAFLAKTSDTHPETMAALRYRAWELFGHAPAGQVPARPAGYEALQWAVSPEPVANLEAVLRTRMRAAPNRRATLAAGRLGWLYSDGPDPEFRAAAG